MRNITVREVEQASRRIADVKGSKRFRISNGWLAQLENGISEPSICKLFSLSVIYRANFLDLLRLYNVDVDHKEKYEPVANPHLTQLLSEENIDHAQPGYGVSIPLRERSTSLMPELAATGATHEKNITCGYLGSNDFTMYPLIRPGSLLKIDTNQNKIEAAAWRHEYERPIFFIELREGYACGWCELQGNQLLIIPHQSSPAGIQRFTYPREAEIVGRVIAYSTRCVDPET